MDLGDVLHVYLVELHMELGRKYKGKKEVKLSILWWGLPYKKP